MSQTRLWEATLPPIARPKPGTSRKNDIAILGCGPAGLLAAHAVRLAGGEPLVYSIKEKSEIPGSLHLRRAVPELTPSYADNLVNVVRMGTPEGYARKVYGDSSHATGWENYSQSYPSWNAIWAYDQLWKRYERNIHHLLIEPGMIEDFLKLFRVVINTLPRRFLCADDEHTFKSVPYWIKSLALPDGEAGREVIIYNGRPEDVWYRYSILGDRCSVESTYGFEGDGVIEGVKAIGNTCTCWRGLVHAGRWAEWRHGVLLNDAFDVAYNVSREVLG
jgi:hypothetical protein